MHGTHKNGICYYLTSSAHILLCSRLILNVVMSLSRNNLVINFGVGGLFPLIKVILTWARRRVLSEHINVNGTSLLDLSRPILLPLTYPATFFNI